MGNRALAFGLVLLAACSGSEATTGGNMDAGGDSTSPPPHDAATFETNPPPVDASQPVDGATDSNGPTDAPTTIGDGAPVVCGAAPCGAGTVCCAIFVDGGVTESCQTSCGDGGAAVGCAGPANCTASAPYCCATIVLNGGTAPACNVSSISSMCTTTCDGQFALSCTATDTARLCRLGGDCATDTQNPNCCDYTFNGATVTACVSNLAKLAGGLTCH
jgi:hypothetical protein